MGDPNMDYERRDAMLKVAFPEPEKSVDTAHDDLMRYFGEVSTSGPLRHGTDGWKRLSKEVTRILAAAKSDLDVERMADAVHIKLCGPFNTVDPQECVHGRQRDVLAAESIIREYRRLTDGVD